MPVLSVAGEPITDAVRSGNVQGDGRTPPDSSYGIWPATTNRLPNGGFETNATGWATVNAATSLVRTTGDAKFGSACAQFQYNGTVNEGISYTPGGAVVAGTIYRLSCWIKVASGGGAGVNFYLAIAGNVSGLVVIGDSQPFVGKLPADGWVRISGLWTAGASDTNAVPYILLQGGVSAVIRADGWQLEASSVTTPYVQTDGATASRVAATLQVPVSGVLASAQGWLAARVRVGFPNSLAQSPYLFDWENDANNRLSFSWNGATGAWRFQIGAAGAFDTADKAGGSFAVGDYKTLIVAWTSTQLLVSVDGSTFTAAVRTKNPAMVATTAYLGSLAGASQLDGDILWLAIGSGLLGSAEIATLAAFGNTDPSDIGALPSSPTMLWTASTADYLVPAAPSPDPSPTSDEIAYALAGVRQLVAFSYRYTRRDVNNAILADITAAVATASVQLDNSRPVLRTARFDILASRLPVGFADSDELVAVEFILHVPGRQDAIFQLGLFQLDYPERVYDTNGQLMWRNTSASDLTTKLLGASSPHAYTLIAGSNYVTAAVALINSLGLTASIADPGYTLRSPLTWEPFTPYLTIVNDLMWAINYFPVWATTTGLITSRSRGTNPAQDTSGVIYTTFGEPRMVVPPFTGRQNKQSALNTFSYAIEDPNQAPVGMTATNVDSSSPISNAYGITRAAQKVVADRVYDIPTLQNIATFDARLQDALFFTADLVTLPDPRRDAHENYRLAIDASAPNTSGPYSPEGVSIAGSDTWRALAWALDCKTGGLMRHRVGHFSVANGVIVQTVQT